MALHKDLPIYKVAYDLLSAATDYVVNMPRPIKAALGGRVSGLCVELVLLIVVRITIVRHNPVVQQEISDGKPKGQYQTRASWDPDVHAMEVNDAALQQSERQQLQILWRPRNCRVRAVARFLCIPSRHGGVSRFIDDARQDKKLAWLQAGQLQVGLASRTEPQSSGPRGDADAQWGNSERFPVGGRYRNKSQQHQHAPTSWLDSETGAYHSYNESRQTAEALIRLGARPHILLHQTIRSRNNCVRP